MPTTTTAGDTAARMKPKQRESAKDILKTKMPVTEMVKASTIPGRRVRRTAAMPDAFTAGMSSSRPLRIRMTHNPEARMPSDHDEGSAAMGFSMPSIILRFTKIMPAISMPSRGGSPIFSTTKAPMWLQNQIRSSTNILPEYKQCEPRVCHSYSVNKGGEACEALCSDKSSLAWLARVRLSYSAPLIQCATHTVCHLTVCHSYSVNKGGRWCLSLGSLEGLAGLLSWTTSRRTRFALVGRAFHRSAVHNAVYARALLFSYGPEVHRGA